MSVPTLHAERRRVVEVLNDALSDEYNSFIGHALNSNPYLPPGTEKDVELLEGIRAEENAGCKALLVHLGRYRSGPYIHAFRHWKEDLNFLGIDYLVIRAAEEAAIAVARAQTLVERLPECDVDLRATFESLVRMKRRHQATLEKVAKQRIADRERRRAAARAVTAVKVKTPQRPGAAAAPAAPAVKTPGAGAPPGAPKPPGAPRPPSPPLPPGAKKPSPPLPPGAKPPSPPLPPGAKPPSSPPLPPGFKGPAGAPSPALPPSFKLPPGAPKAPSSSPAAPVPALPPGFKLPGGATPPAPQAAPAPSGGHAAPAVPKSDWKPFVRPKGRPLPPDFKGPVDA